MSGERLSSTPEAIRARTAPGVVTGGACSTGAGISARSAGAGDDTGARSAAAGAGAGVGSAAAAGSVILPVNVAPSAGAGGGARSAAAGGGSVILPVNIATSARPAAAAATGILPVNNARGTIHPIIGSPIATMPPTLFSPHAALTDAAPHVLVPANVSANAVPPAPDSY